MLKLKQSVVDKVLSVTLRLRAWVRASGQHFEQPLKWNVAFDRSHFSMHKLTFN